MSTATEQQAATPKKELVTPTQNLFKKYPELAHVYTMFYRHGMSVSVSKTFYFEDKSDDKNIRLRNAIERARKHCKVMGYHYVFLLPFINDIDVHEDYRLNGSEVMEVKL